MRMKSFQFGVFAGANALVARASPQKIVPIFPIRNSTTPTPTATGATCENRCAVEYPQITGIQWIPESQILYTTTITVATESIIIVTSDNSTWLPQTQTVYNDDGIAPAYNLYSLGTDAQGTAVVTVPIPQSDGVTFYSRFTYPTPYVDYATEYRWQGVLQTHDKALSPVCATSSPMPDTVGLPSHPEYPQPKQDFEPGRFDQFGLESKPLWVPLKEEPDKAFFDSAFPSESAFSSCESLDASAPLPTQYEAPKYVTVSTTVYTDPSTVGVIVIQPSATGWETTCCYETPDIPRVMSTATGFGEETSPWPGLATSSKAAIARIESTATGFGPQDPPPQAPQTGHPDAPANSKPPGLPNIPDILVSVIKNNPSIFVSKTQIPPANAITPVPAVLPTPAPAAPAPAPTPIFTYVPSVINGQSTTIPAYILPGSSETATLGQSVTINGQPTVLAAPPAFYTTVLTTINGVATSIPAFIISGTSTATLGQTITLDGNPTVLAAPTPILTWVSTTINGVPTSSPAYIIDGTSTATLGETVTLNGQATVLATTSAVLTWLSSTINGIPTSTPVYIISGTSTATIGQTVTINGSITVLSTPTSTLDPDPGLGGPVATTFGPQATTSPPSKGAGLKSFNVPSSAALLFSLVVFIMGV